MRACSQRAMRTEASFSHLTQFVIPRAVPWRCHHRSVPVPCWCHHGSIRVVHMDQCTFGAFGEGFRKEFVGLAIPCSGGTVRGGWRRRENALGTLGGRSAAAGSGLRPRRSRVLSQFECNPRAPPKRRDVIRFPACHNWQMTTYAIAPRSDQTGFDVVVVADNGVRQTVLGFKTKAEAETWIEEDKRRETPQKTMAARRSPPQ